MTLHIIPGVIIGVVLGIVCAIGSTLYSLTSSNIVGKHVHRSASTYIDENDPPVYHAKNDKYINRHSL